MIETHTLPEIVWAPTPNMEPRDGHHVERVVLHTWGEPTARYDSIKRYFQNPHSDASAHFIFPGKQWPNRIIQMVPYRLAAWTEKAYNRSSVEIECADAIWSGHDDAGLQQLAHIVGFLLHHFGLDPAWRVNGGFCRHGDLGALGGSHPVCPTGDLSYFHGFSQLVHQHYTRRGYRARWGR